MKDNPMNQNMLNEMKIPIKEEMTIEQFKPVQSIKALKLEVSKAMNSMNKKNLNFMLDTKKLKVKVSMLLNG